jgi:hypothetical protein
MTSWMTATVELPRWVVWGALLTSPALWSRQFVAIVKQRLSRPEDTEHAQQQ